MSNSRRTPYRDYDIITLNSFVHESMLVSAAWRAESWRDCEMYDGQQWTTTAYDEAKAAAIEPLTINRIAPIVNYLLGTQILNDSTILAKGRTAEDTEIGNILSEGVQYVMDQCDGKHLISTAFRDQIIPGIGFLDVRRNTNPRRERIRIGWCDWKDIGWDPFGDPFLDPVRCRYLYYQPWMDLDDLMDLYPEKEEELHDAWAKWSGQGLSNIPRTAVLDEATYVEEMKQRIAVSSYNRKRVRPVEMWYPLYEWAIIASMPNGNYLELSPLMTDSQLAEVMSTPGVVIERCRIQKMHTKTFLGQTVLHEGYSPYHHDEYPFVSYIGYLDRFKQPYGVPRNIRGQNEEVNKRRSMALAMLKGRRVVMEDDAIKDPEKNAQKTYEEINKIDGFVILRPGGLQKIKVEEQAELYRPQMELLLQSEREMKEIAGANDENLGYEGQAISGVAIQRRQAQGNTINASLFNNLRRANKRLTELVIAEIQGEWTAPKVLRVTDKMTNVERFIKLNEHVFGPSGEIEIRNNVTQGRFDVVVSEAPPTDTMREQFLNMLIEWTKRVPPEVVPQIVVSAIELSGLPNKETLLNKIKPLMGVNPLDEDIPQEEQKKRIIQAMQEEQQAKFQAKQLTGTEIQLKMENLKLTNDKLQAEIAKIMSDIKVRRDEQELQGVKAGFEMRKQVRDREEQKMITEGEAA